MRLADQDFAVGVRHQLIPSVYAAGIIIKENCMGRKEAVTYSGPTYIVVRSGKHSSSTATTHAKDLIKLLTLDDFKNLALGKDGKVKPVMILSVDGGADENPRYTTIRLYQTVYPTLKSTTWMGCSFLRMHPVDWLTTELSEGWHP